MMISLYSREMKPMIEGLQLVSLFEPLVKFLAITNNEGIAEMRCM